MKAFVLKAYPACLDLIADDKIHVTGFISATPPVAKARNDSNPFTSGQRC